MPKESVIFYAMWAFFRKMAFCLFVVFFEGGLVLQLLALIVGAVVMHQYIKRF